MRAAAASSEAKQSSTDRGQDNVRGIASKGGRSNDGCGSGMSDASGTGPPRYAPPAGDVPRQWAGAPAAATSTPPAGVFLPPGGAFPRPPSATRKGASWILVIVMLVVIAGGGGYAAYSLRAKDHRLHRLVGQINTANSRIDEQNVLVNSYKVCLADLLTVGNDLRAGNTSAVVSDETKAQKDCGAVGLP